MRYEVVITELAIAQFERIGNNIDHTFGNAAYIRFLQAFERLVDFLEQFPLAYPFSKRTNVRKAVLEGLTLVFYIVEDKKVEIVAVLDGRMDHKG